MKKMFMLQSNSVHIFISISYLCLLHIPNVRTAEDLLLQLCSNTGNYTFGNPFDINLTFLLSSVSNNASNTGYESSSRGVSPDIVYALAQCRDDLSTLDCITCLNDASSNITGICPSGMEATVRFGNCLLRYSSSRFFSKTSNMMRTTYTTETVPSTDGTYFSQSLEALMTSLSKTAASNETRFSYGDTEYDPSGTIYGMVQCIRDLLPSDCEKCLQDMISSFPNCCNRTTAATVSGPTCYLRYQILPFMGVSSQPPLHVPRFLPQTTTNNKTNTGKSNETNTGISGGKSTSPAVIAVPIIVTVVLLAICGYCIARKLLNSKRNPKSKKIAIHLASIARGESSKPNEDHSVDVSQTSLDSSFDHSSIRSQQSPEFKLKDIIVATDEFNEANKLGSGGFGEVYKGKLTDDQVIAVKRLSKDSQQGDKQFLNEVNSLLNLQHINLVSLRGYCVEGNEKLLIYEFVQNTSLDKYIFDSTEKASLDWKTRYAIIEGVERGLVYLHEESRLKIVHMDLKAGNILLDENMNAKIADFGTARVFGQAQTQDETRRTSGTYGYMAPEYALRGEISVKCDVFSFGVILLEIISGKKANGFQQEAETSKDLPSYAWNLWKKGCSKQLMDPILGNVSDETVIKRCIQIGLLCVQHNPKDRPKMSAVHMMLMNGQLSLKSPGIPASLLQSKSAIQEENIEQPLIGLQASNSLDMC